jgi:hypothetical protein
MELLRQYSQLLVLADKTEFAAVRALLEAEEPSAENTG